MGIVWLVSGATSTSGQAMVPGARKLLANCWFPWHPTRDPIKEKPRKYGAALELKAAKWVIPEKTRRPASLTIPTRQNPGMTPPGIELVSPSWKASSLTTTPPQPLGLVVNGRECEERTLGVAQPADVATPTGLYLPPGPTPYIHHVSRMRTEPPPLRAPSLPLCDLTPTRLSPAPPPLPITRHPPTAPGLGVESWENLKGGHDGVVRSLSYHQGEPGYISGRLTPKFSHVGITLDDAAGRRVFSGISRFPRSCIPAMLHARLASPSSALKTPIVEDPRDGFSAESAPTLGMYKVLNSDF
ncbi:hypothetical protein PR048_018178 [Dryococelus australis]|uniref:Uncharacterized protein n=1 Tax=Dryococelus australis TaxID=614101 RepID=A0ABQ9HBP6_9NEOP|nr:hypothetical protein PR048_018178 [Dryococelus australis]